VKEWGDPFFARLTPNQRTELGKRNLVRNRRKNLSKTDEASKGDAREGSFYWVFLGEKEEYP